MTQPQLEANKRIVRDYFDAGNRGDFDSQLAYFDDDNFKLICRARPPLGYSIDKPRLAQMMKDVDNVLKGPLQVTIDLLTAEDDRVAVQAHSRGERVQGGLYENNYHFLFTIRNNKIIQIEEYLCSYTMSKDMEEEVWQDAGYIN